MFPGKPDSIVERPSRNLLLDKITRGEGGWPRIAQGTPTRVDP